MTITTWKAQGIKIAGTTNATTGLAAFSAYCNNVQWSENITDLEYTGMGATSRARVNGLPDVTVTMSGWLNTTTEAVLGAIRNGTSVNKLIEAQQGTGVYYRAFFVPTSIQFTGAPDTLGVFSATFANSSGTITRTSVAKA